MLLWSRFVLLGRPGRIFRQRLKRERSRPDHQAAESHHQAENLQDYPDKIQQYTIHRGHPLPLSRIGNGCKEGAILPAWRVRASQYNDPVLCADGAHPAQNFLDLTRIQRVSHADSTRVASGSSAVYTCFAAKSSGFPPSFDGGIAQRRMFHVKHPREEGWRGGLGEGGAVARPAAGSAAASGRATFLVRDRLRSGGLPLPGASSRRAREGIR